VIKFIAAMIALATATLSLHAADAIRAFSTNGHTVYHLRHSNSGPDTGTLYLGSTQSGGDGIYAVNLAHPDWAKALQNLYPVGRLAEIVRNLANLSMQIGSFKRPAYQKTPRKTTVITGKSAQENRELFPKKEGYQNAEFVQFNLLSGKYHDVIIPSMEETNGRTQAISLSGRMGLWLTGKFDRISGRAVTDNANFSRFWEWGAQQHQHHLVRSMALRAALGADIFLVNVYQGDPRDMSPFYRMIEKGVIAIPARDELLSVSPLCLGMRDPSPRFLEHGKNGHGMSTFREGEPPAVFDRLDCYWGGAPTQRHDFSRHAFGSRRRMLNFLPTMRYGLIASVPADTKTGEGSRFRSMLQTDGEVFYDGAQKIMAIDHWKWASSIADSASMALPVRVQGDVAWSAVRLDRKHVRVTLIDSGYTDPADRNAVIELQHLDAVWCRDILSREPLPITEDPGKSLGLTCDKEVILTVPAASLRVIDIEHR
jgi:hypothetical protein